MLLRHDLQWNLKPSFWYQLDLDIGEDMVCMLSEAHHLRANKNAEVDLPSDAFVKYSDKSLQTPNSIFVASLHM